MQKIITDDLEALLDIFPPHIQKPLNKQEDIHELVEVILDLGRTPEARFPLREVVLNPEEVTEQSCGDGLDNDCDGLTDANDPDCQGSVNHIVTASAGSNGDIYPSGEITVNHNDTQEFTVNPDNGYIAVISGTCGGNLDSDIYTTNPVTAATAPVIPIATALNAFG